MGYARHIGRVGALAVTLGVGAAIANSPGIAYAGPSDPSATGDSPSVATSPSTKKSPTTKKSPPTNETPVDKGAASADGDDADPPASDRKSLRSVLRSAAESIRDRGTGTTGASRDDDTPGKGEPPAQEEDETQDLVSGNLVGRKASTANTSRLAHTRSLADTLGDVKAAVNASTQRGEKTIRRLGTPGPTDTATTYSIATAPIDTARTAVTRFSEASALTPQPASRPRTSIVPIFTDALGSVLQPLVSPGTGSPPLQLPTLAALLAAVRDEVERILVPRPTQVAYPPTASQPVDNRDLPAATDQHVLVIAIDGTNMSKVLADDGTPNTNFIKLMNTSTTSAPSIVGHTTVSNPSWTAILTGAWDNKTGVINNVYTPWTYDKWPTVFTQLETDDPTIRTKAIADWDVIGAIAASGVGADEVVYISQKPDDPDWSKTDAAVTDETVKTILDTEDKEYGDVPNFMVTYLVQVDEAGHMYGGDSPQYDAAIQRTDFNLGAIVAAVEAREQATGEDWTVIVVTDHGHQPQQGFGHGFQSPRETETFVIVDGPQFESIDDDCEPDCGRFNPNYEIVDVTPTVLSLFGAQPDRRSDGVPLQSLNGSSSDPLTQAALHEALEAQIASNDYPNIVVNAALSLRTIVAFLPYFVHGAGLPAPLGDILYVATNVPAQVVAFLTGIHGASIFPLLPPPPAITFIPDEATSIDAAFRMDCGVGSLAAAACIAS
jgi:Type I phosphodiesterase / nucleotide pyrophosphatase